MKTETKWAIIAAVALFLILIIEKMMGLQVMDRAGTGGLIGLVIGIVLFIVVYFMETREKREYELNGMMSWKEGFWSAAIMTIIFIPLSCLLVYIFLKFINPGAAGSWMEFSNNPTGKDPVNNFMYLHLLNGLSLGLIFSLIIPFFTKKEA